jgi:hypothetical protein
VLGKTDSRVPNAHLNPSYFSGECTDAFTAANMPAAGKSGTPPSIHVADTVRMTVPAGLRAPAKGKGMRSRRVKTIVLAALLVILLVGALAPMRSSKDAIASSELIPLREQVADEAPPPVLTTPFEPAAERQPVAPPAPAAAAPQKLTGPIAVVMVPGAGLRKDHSITSRIITGSSLKDGERVAILQRFSGGSGPSWVQVRTKTGKTGWVFASLVHQKR